MTLCHLRISYLLCIISIIYSATCNACSTLWFEQNLQRTNKECRYLVIERIKSEKYSHLSHPDPTHNSFQNPYIFSGIGVNLYSYLRCLMIIIYLKIKSNVSVSCFRVIILWFFLKFLIR